MAQRFGGEHSPGGRAKPAVAAGGPAAPMWRATVLFVAPFPLAVRAFFQDPMGLALFLAAFAVLALAAWFTRDGMAARATYDAREVARRPAFPRLMFGSVLTGAGIALAVWADAGGTVGPVVLGLLGTALHFMAFGSDPLTDKGAGDLDLFQRDRVARAVGTAEGHLSEMSEAIKRLKNRALTQRVQKFQTTARDMFRTVEDDPRDLTAARKYLGVYLQGARDATIKFVEMYSRSPDDAALRDYQALLDDLEANFARRTEKLLSDDRSDLDIEIQVLRDRLNRDAAHN